MKRISSLISLFLILLLSSLVQAAIYTASNESGWDTAYATASNGDTIQITASWTSTKQYNVEKAIIIEGINNPTITLGVDVSYQFYLKVNGITIKNFTLDGDKTNRADGTGIGCAESTNNQLISRMVITDFVNFGIACENGSSDITITGCTIRTCDSSSYGLVYLYYSNSVKIGNCIFSGDSSCQCGQHGIYADNSSNGVVFNSSFLNIAKDVIHLTDGSDSWSISNNRISNWALSADGRAFYIYGDNCSIFNNVIIQDINSGYLATVFYNYGDSTTIKFNTVCGNYLYLILRTVSHPVTFRNNVCIVSDVNGSVPNRVNLTDSDGSIFAYNLWNVAVSGADEIIYRFESDTAGSRTINVYNDTIVNSSSGGIAIKFNEGTTGTWGAVEVKNCIIKGFTKGVVVEDRDDDGIAIVHKNNDYYENTANLQKDVNGTYTDITLDSSEITTDPLLSPNLRLTGISPCINAGTTISGFTSTALDIDGQPILGTPDIGCDERKALWKDNGNWHLQRFF